MSVLGQDFDLKSNNKLANKHGFHKADHTSDNDDSTEEIKRVEESIDDGEDSIPIRN